MKLRAFKDLIDKTVSRLRDHEDPEVVIPIAKTSVGLKASVDVDSISKGIDWNKNKFFLHTKEKLVPKSDKEQAYDMAWEFLLWIATKPVKKETYEVREARRIFDLIGYDYMKYQRFLHQDKF